MAALRNPARAVAVRHGLLFQRGDDHAFAVRAAGAAGGYKAGCHACGLSGQRVGGLAGAVAMLLAGNWSDRRGDRFLNAFWWIGDGRLAAGAGAGKRAGRGDGRLSGLCGHLLHGEHAALLRAGPR
jgi:hypothetical protein